MVKNPEETVWIGLEYFCNENDEFWNEACVGTFKMILLGASYDHILSNDSVLRDVICCSYNTSDIHIFRDWDDFEYHFDTSTCEKGPELLGSIIHIFAKKTGKEVWRIGVGEKAEKALEKELKDKDDLK